MGVFITAVAIILMAAEITTSHIQFSIPLAGAAFRAARNGLKNLSMGMSADFAIAIQFGATHVRVGSAIFGAR